MILFLTTPTVASDTDKEYDLFSSKKFDKVLQDIKKNESRVNDSDPPIFEDVDMKNMADNILNLKDKLTEKYAIADGIGMGMYILRYFAELGRHSLSQKEIFALVKTYEKLTGNRLDLVTKDILTAIERIHFNKTNKGTYYIKADTFEEDGATIVLNKPGEPGAAITELTSLYFANGTMIIFNDIETKEENKGLVYGVRKVMKFIGLPLIMKSELNQVHPVLYDTIKNYSKSEKNITPLQFWYTGISTIIQTTSLLGEMELMLTGGISLPGIKKGDEPIPSLVLNAKTNMLNFKLSVDK